MSEESVACRHHERIEEHHHYAIGTCGLCGQIRRYDRFEHKQPPKIIKIGRINGVPTLEHPPKEVIKVVQNKLEVDSIARHETAPVPRKYKARQQPLRDYEADKEAILDDYQDLTLKEFYAKQQFCSNTWTKLKKKWGVKGKNQRKSKPAGNPDTLTKCI